MTASPFARYAARKGTRPAARPGAWVLLAAWGPCGFAPVAPGTFGTLGAIPLYLVLSRLSPSSYVSATASLLIIGSWAAERAGKYWGVADASPIVIDEVVGYLVTLALVPFSWQAVAAAFVLFRIFDVVKPWPASAFDRVKNGFGVMMDDVAAGIWAWSAIQALRLLRVLP